MSFGHQKLTLTNSLSPYTPTLTICKVLVQESSVQDIQGDCQEKKPSKTKMIEADEISSASLTPRPATILPTEPISSPPSLYHSPSLTRSPLGNPDIAESPKSKTLKTPRLSLTPRFITPLGSPVRKAIRLTKLDPQDAWLPITESRNGDKLILCCFSYSMFRDRSSSSCATCGLHYSWQGLGNNQLDCSICMAALHTMGTCPTP